MINLHIIQNEKFTRGAIKFCREIAPVENNPFVVFGGGYSYSYDEFDNVKIMGDNIGGIIKLIKLMRQADRIHLYGLFSHYLVLVLALNRKLAAKCNWFIYGNDLYYVTNSYTSLGKRIHVFFRKRALRNIRCVSTNVVGDYKLLCSITNTEYQFHELRFSRGSVDSIVKYLNEENINAKNSAPYKILLGNSATATNCHFEAIDNLAKYQKENILVYAPLSYGDRQYAEQVAEYGKKKLGNKFIPIFDFMPADKYFEFLATINIAVFAHNRQQGVGNIVPLIYAGAKVYLRDNVTTWDSMVNQYGISLFPFKNIKDEDFSQFVENSIDVKLQREKCLSMTDPDSEREAFLKTLV